MLPRGIVGAQIYSDILLKEHKGPVSLAFNIIAKWWKIWMATVDITTGVQMKQRENERDEAEEGEGRRHQWGAIMSLKAMEGIKLTQGREKNA